MDYYPIPARMRLAILFSVVSVCLLGLSLIAVGAIARAAAMGDAIPMVAAAVGLAGAGLLFLGFGQRLMKSEDRSRATRKEDNPVRLPGWAR